MRQAACGGKICSQAPGKPLAGAKIAARHLAIGWRRRKLQLGTWPLDGGGENCS